MVATVAPYGSWVTPINSATVVADHVRFEDLEVDSSNKIDETVYWSERRADGRSVVCSCTGGAGIVEWTTPEHNVVSKVHEYGGGAFFVHNGMVYYVNKNDQKLYVQSGPGKVPFVLGCKGRYADGLAEPIRGNLFFVHEDHTNGNGDGDTKFSVNPVASIVSINVQSKEQSVVVTGADFYSSPKISFDGTQLAWIEWSHPAMPWTSSELWIAKLKDDGLSIREETKKRVAGGGNVSVLGPQWANDGSLFWMSDENGFWNLYYGDHWSGLEGDGDANMITDLIDHDCARVPWKFGQNHFAISADNRYVIMCTNDPAKGDMLMLIRRGGLGTKPEYIKSSWSVVHNMRLCATGKLFLVAGSRTRVNSLIQIDLIEHGYATGRKAPEHALKGISGRLFGFYEKKVNAILDTVDSYTGVVDNATQAVASYVEDLAESWYGDTSKVIRQSQENTIPRGYISPARHFEYHTRGRASYAYYYAPVNQDYKAMDGELPPLLVKCHSGPTSQASPVINPFIQYWTSRGIAIADVNYSGSSGYGKEYRDRLNGQWGIADVDDVCACADFLISKGRADPNRIMIDGSSAGGYTTLACLTFKDTFKAGCSIYGVSDLAALASSTHKFEAKYLDMLIGSLPKHAKRYTERSPITHVNRIECPIIIMHGMDDVVVSPDQAKVMYNAVREKGHPVSLVMFDGEGHGFRRSETIQLALDAEFFFFSTVLKWPLPADFPKDVAERVDISNSEQKTDPTQSHS
eukprot:CFRG8506T1